MSSFYCVHYRSIFTDKNGIGFTGEYLSTYCEDCKKMACYHLDIIETISRCNSCHCHATQQDVIRHLQIFVNDGHVDDSNDKCPCGHSIKEHPYFYSQIKKRKREPLTIMNLIINGDHFIILGDVCDFLHLKDIAVLDSAFTNHKYRTSWNDFLEKKYEFKINLYANRNHMFKETYIQQLLKYGIWLKLKRANVSLLDLGRIAIHESYDISEYNKVVNNSFFEDVEVDMTKYYEEATILFYKYTFCRVKELRIINSTSRCDENEIEIEVWSEIINLIPQIFNNIVILDLQLGLIFSDRELSNFASPIAKYCTSLSEIYLEGLEGDTVNELCKTLKESNNTSLTILSFQGWSCGTKVLSLEYLQRFHLKELFLHSYYVCNKSITLLVNNCTSLKTLSLKNVKFSSKLVSDWLSESLEELAFDNCCFVEYKIDFLGFNYRSLKCVSEFTQSGDLPYGIFETVTKYDDKLEEFLWPKYNESLYFGIKLEFKNITLSNLHILNINDDTLVTEETLINQIIRNGGKLKEIYIFNWHCTDLSLDAIGDSCPHLSTIGLYVDDLRMTEAGLKRLIDKCLQLKFIVFHYDPNSNLRSLNIMLQYYPFDDICRNRNISIYFKDLTK